MTDCSWVAMLISKPPIGPWPSHYSVASEGKRRRRSKRDFDRPRLLRAKSHMSWRQRTRKRIGFLACAGAFASLALAPGAGAAIWVIKGHGFGHGVGMSQYGAYGLARHGRDYRSILGHYYRHPKVGHATDSSIRVLLDSGKD